MPANQSTPEVTSHAADILDQYASFIRNDVKADDFERHPYVPEIEETAQALRDLATPARGGDELRATAQFLSDRLDDLEWMDGDLESTLRDFMGHVDPAHARLKSALASTDMAGAGETPRERIARVVAWEHFGIAWKHMEKASHADVLAMVDRMLAAPPVEGLTSGGKRSDADLLRLIAKDHARLAPNAYHSAETLEQIADRLDAPKAAATASVRDHIAGDGKLVEHLRSYAGTCTGLEPRRILTAAADRLATLTHSGTAATIGGERA